MNEVVDALTLETRVHRQPGRKGYVKTVGVAPADELTPGLAPWLRLWLIDLELE